MVSLSKILYPNSGSVLFDEDLNLASFQGLDDAIGSLVIMAWNQKANIGSQEMHQYLKFLQVVQAMDVPAVSLHYCSQELLSTATFKPCNIMLLLFCQREWEGRWWRRWWLEEVIKVKECGLKTGDVKLENPCAPWLVVLFNIWCHICQALAEGQKAGTSDDEHMRSKSCSLDSILSSFSSNTAPALPIKHSSERAHADNDLYLMASVDAPRDHDDDDEDHDQSPMDLLVWNTRIS